MIPQPTSLPARIALYLALLLASGCASVSDPTRFYTLHPSPSGGDGQTRAAADTRTIGLGPIYFPRLLNRPQIVTRESDSEVRLAEFHQWGGALEEDFSRVLAANLARRVDGRVYVYPRENRAKPDTQIQLSVDRFDGVLGEYVQFEGQWHIVNAGPPRARRLSLRQPLEADGYVAYVEGMSRLLDQIAAQIAETLRSGGP